MSIPKIIHYCWFGGNPIPTKVLKCIESWKKFCPDYEIIKWTEDNYDVNKNEYMKNAYHEKKWAFVADYARLDILYQYGGIYLDTDVELISEINCLLENEAFMAIEKHSVLVATGLGFGCHPGNIHIKNLIDLYQTLSFYKNDGKINTTPCTIYTTNYFQQYGYLKKDMTQNVDNMIILASEYLCPIDYNTGKIHKTQNTLGIHWYDASWLSSTDKCIHDTEIKICKIFPDFIAKILCNIYRNGYRCVEYLRKGIFWEKLKEKVKKVF